MASRLTSIIRGERSFLLHVYLITLCAAVTVNVVQGFSLPVLSLPSAASRAHTVNRQVIVQPLSINSVDVQPEVAPHTAAINASNSAAALSTSALKLLNIEQSAWLRMHPLQRALAIGIPSALFISRGAATADTANVAPPTGFQMDGAAAAHPVVMQSRAGHQPLNFPPPPRAAGEVESPPVLTEALLHNLERHLDGDAPAVAPAAVPSSSPIGPVNNRPAFNAGNTADPMNAAVLPLIYYLLNGMNPMRFNQPYGASGAGQFSEEIGFRSRRSAAPTPSIHEALREALNTTQRFNSSAARTNQTSGESTAGGWEQAELLADMQRLGVTFPGAPRQLVLPSHLVSALERMRQADVTPEVGDPRAAAPTAVEPSVLEGFLRKGVEIDAKAGFEPAPGLLPPTSTPLPVSTAAVTGKPATDKDMFCTCIPMPKQTTTVPVFS
ncbi:uncharacterized protein LOC129587216 [Paramacrobiotus metropolitanus]|uniref:uncharacterized protein LOC129587216 n=1 Tax=Paramacrobiotus metropolitanus TaxID=2943436 RepID=UPI002445E037|nr:uncharacterized protein LOC129587216 [Paramacrobiotus metropolitanus]